jgi:hypothetical protein
MAINNVVFVVIQPKQPQNELKARNDRYQGRDNPKYLYRVIVSVSHPGYVSLDYS